MITNNDINDLLGDQETGAFHVMNEGFHQPDEVYPVMSEVDGNAINVWYSNGQVLSFIPQWKQLPPEHPFFNKG